MMMYVSVYTCKYGQSRSKGQENEMKLEAIAIKTEQKSMLLRSIIT
jgi:hypothetical protein